MNSAQTAIAIHRLERRARTGAGLSRRPTVPTTPRTYA
jgi:hypothetical protein